MLRAIGAVIAGAIAIPIIIYIIYSDKKATKEFDKIFNSNYRIAKEKQIKKSVPKDKNESNKLLKENKNKQSLAIKNNKTEYKPYKNSFDKSFEDFKKDFDKEWNRF